MRKKIITLTVFIRFRFYWPLTAKKYWFYANGMSLNFSQCIFNSCNHHTKDQDQDEHINIIIINHVTTSFFSSRKQILPKIAQNTNLTLNSLCFCWYFFQFGIALSICLFPCRSCLMAPQYEMLQTNSPKVLTEQVCRNGFAAELLMFPPDLPARAPALLLSTGPITT